MVRPVFFPAMLVYCDGTRSAYAPHLGIRPVLSFETRTIWISSANPVLWSTLSSVTQRTLRSGLAAFSKRYLQILTPPELHHGSWNFHIVSLALLVHL
ncbi:hypothetical protein CC86DRAFT_179584 [Ophiobolus disseminans]|uniref:Uncharacterized protein n=1 Tax=Ophiobolus disseminans TaxID=1469910 RepID=A0A6A7A9R7_9PLEO|nr:hypothetical protein CC86DRAFT_179584 [Ophiobolus disseminans]